MLLGVTSILFASIIGTVFADVNFVLKINSKTTVQGLKNNVYESFLGIPYAKPPVGALRFEDPKPVSMKSGTIKARTQKDKCIQKDRYFRMGIRPTIVGSEDCLYLNIYRPVNLKAGRKLPVFFYIHGGAFVTGSSDQSFLRPTFLLSKEIEDLQDKILVVIQYRLSAMGFFSTGDRNCPGNFGLKDQRAALRWVKKYIGFFGGDVRQITVAGHDVGAASAQLHMLSKNSSNEALFSKVLAMSGSSISPALFPSIDPLGLARKHADALNIRGATTMATDLLLKAMRELEARDIIDTVDKLKNWDEYPLTIYRPVIEADYKGAFLTEDPVYLFKTGRFFKVPMMSGHVKSDGLLYSGPLVTDDILRRKVSANLSELIPDLLELKSEGEKRKNFTQEVLRRYLAPRVVYNTDTEGAFMKMFSDRFFIYPIYKQIQLMSQNTTSLFMYEMDYRGYNSYSPLYTNNNTRNFGSVHGDELLYVFESPALGIGLWNNIERNSIQKKLLKFYNDFIFGRVQQEVVMPGESLCHIYKFSGNSAKGPKQEMVEVQLREYLNFWDKSEEY